MFKNSSLKYMGSHLVKINLVQVSSKQSRGAIPLESTKSGLILGSITTCKSKARVCGSRD